MEHFIVQNRNGCVNIVIDRQEHRNAFTLAMWLDLIDIFKEIKSDKENRVVLLTGSGGESFSSGADISEMTGSRYSLAIEGRTAHPITEVARLIEDLGVPVIAGINGYAIGGGCELAVACDLRVAVESAKLGITSAKVGICISVENIKRLIALVGPAKAKDLLFTGRLITAREALAIGLVDYVLPKGELDAFTSELAERMIANAPLSIKYTKETIKLISRIHDLEDIGDEFRFARKCFDSRDFKEGVKAFLEKRQPIFEGK